MSAQDWISVKERLPEGNVEVLGVISEPDAMVIDIVLYSEQDETWTRAADLFGEEPVSHWMPLPDLPKDRQWYVLTDGHEVDGRRLMTQEEYEDASVSAREATSDNWYWSQEED